MITKRTSIIFKEMPITARLIGATVFAASHGVLFVGQANSIAPDVTPQNAASHLGLFCLHREFSSKNEIKNKNHS